MRNVRTKYITCFHRGLSDLRAEGRLIQPEVRVELNVPQPHELYDVLVVDALETKSDGSIGAIKIVTDPVPASFPGLRFDSDVSWHALMFCCLSEGFPEDRLLAFARRWIHDEAPALGPQDDLTGVIHSVTRPVHSEGLAYFSVDFGSAPFDAFEELVLAFQDHLQSLSSDPSDESSA